MVMVAILVNRQEPFEQTYISLVGQLEPDFILSLLGQEAKYEIWF